MRHYAGMDFLKVGGRYSEKGRRAEQTCQVRRGVRTSKYADRLHKQRLWPPATRVKGPAGSL